MSFGRTTSIPSSYPQSACLPTTLTATLRTHYCEVIAFQINECVPGGAEDEDARPDDDEEGEGALC